MTGKKILFIYNPYSGKGSIKTNLADVIEELTANDNILTIFPTRQKNHAKELTLKHAENFDLVVCSGGDGTLNEVINGLITFTTPPLLGYIPTGTSNDFASNLNLTNTPAQTAKTIINGKPFAVDIGTLNEKAFSYFAGFGLFTDVSHQTHQDFKNLLGRTAYILEGIKRLTNIPTHNLTVETDKETIQGEFVFGMITNSATVGGFKGLESDNFQLDDGLFELVLVYNPKNPIETQALLQCLLTKTNNPKYIYRAEVGYAKIKSDIPIDWTLDGEFGGTYSELTIKNYKQAISIMVE